MKITEQDLRFQATQNVVGFTTPQSCMSGCFDSSFSLIFSMIGDMYAFLVTATCKMSVICAPHHASES